MREICVHLTVDEEAIMNEVKDTGVNTLEEAISQELNWLSDSGITVKEWSFEKDLQPFYFTFGTSETQPYMRGWLEIFAEGKNQAIEIFRSRYPDRIPGLINCSFIYDKEAFANIQQKYYLNDPTWNICHETLRADTAKDISSQNENIKDVVALVCIHETKYGNDIYVSLHPDSKDALSHIDAVKEECEFDEEGYQEYFDSDIHFLQVDVSRLQTHKEFDHQNQVKQPLAHQISSAQEKKTHSSSNPIPTEPER